GIGTVVTDTVTGGRLERGENVVIHPRNVAARIRSVESHGRDLETAEPGMRTAINLPEVSVGPAGTQRGDVITCRRFERSPTLDVLLTRSARFRRAVPVQSGASAFVQQAANRPPATR